MKAKWMIALLAAGLLVGMMSLALADGEQPAAGAGAQAGVQAKGPGAGMLRAVMDKLTAEQKTQLMAKLKELREKNATREETRAAVQELLKGWNIELPKGAGKGQGAGPQEGRGTALKEVMDKLTPEQKTQLLAKIKELRDKNASQDEIHEAVAAMLKGWGIELPAGPQGQGQHAWMDKLTPDQKTQVQAKIKELRAKNATPEEIKAAIAELLKGWGVEPGKGQGGAGQGQGVGQRKGWMAQLTEEQKTQLQAKTKELREKNATKEEIRAAVQEMLKGWGIQPGQGQGQGAGPGRGQGQGGPLQGIMGKLTAEQKTQVMAKIKELREKNAGRDEIRKAVEEMLKGWGIQPPAAAPAPAADAKGEQI